jgi:glycosyltransferase involved in cell wall biosynthesis
MTSAAGGTRPQTLLISPWTPYPLVFGGAIRVYYLMKMLASFSDVTLVAFQSWHDLREAQEHLETICTRVVLVEGKPAQSAPLRVRATLSRRSFQHHAHITPHMQAQIDEAAAATDFDTIVVTLTQMGFYELPAGKAVRVLDMHNIEHELLRRRASVERKRSKRAALSLEAYKFTREERQMCRSYDLVLTPSDRERDMLRALDGFPPTETVPNTIDPERIEFLADTAASNELLFVGATQVDANRDGLIWFVTQILPLIEARVPDVVVRIVGGDPPPEVQRLAERPSVVVTGYVPEIAPCMAGAAIFIVPLRSGGGTRLKILESLAYGVPTVSTTVGAEGLGLVHGEHLLISDTPAGFADNVVTLLQDRRLGDRLRRSGRAAVEARFSWQSIGSNLHRAIEAVRDGAAGRER